MQNLIPAKCFNSFLHFLFWIKSTKNFSFEPKLKYQKIKLVCKSSFLFFWKKNELCIIYDISWNQGHIQGKTKQWNIWKRSVFLKEIKILLLVYSTKIVNFWKTVLIIPVQRYSILVLRLLFVTNFPQQNFPNINCKWKQMVISKIEYQIYIRFSFYLQIIVSSLYLERCLKQYFPLSLILLIMNCKECD